MVYGRKIAGLELTLEASGALQGASLVMRDRETDSWWSLMTSSAIGGELEGAILSEIPGAEKTTWKAWRDRHPETLVLSVDGREHVAANPYDSYFASERTFREVELEDRRLPAKEAIFAFRLGGRQYAVPHSSIGSGTVFEVDGSRIFLARPSGDPLFASTRAFLLDGEWSGDREDATELLTRTESGGLEPLPGFDTFWYTWIAVNPQTRILR